jgi:hypothetical protein
MFLFGKNYRWVFYEISTKRANLAVAWVKVSPEFFRTLHAFQNMASKGLLQCPTKWRPQGQRNFTGSSFHDLFGRELHLFSKGHLMEEKPSVVDINPVVRWTEVCAGNQFGRGHPSSRLRRGSVSNEFCDPKVS